VDGKAVNINECRCLSRNEEMVRIKVMEETEDKRVTACITETGRTIAMIE